jgi:Protein of unknown function (DUF3168)
MTTLYEAQRTIFATLANDATLRGLVTGVFDAVPAGTAFPYITIGELSESDFATFDREGSEDTITLHIWSEYRGNTQQLRILDRINELLDGANLTMTGQTLVSIAYENGVTVNEPELRHFVARYRLRIQEA